MSPKETYDRLVKLESFREFLALDVDAPVRDYKRVQQAMRADGITPRELSDALDHHNALSNLEPEPEDPKDLGTREITRRTRRGQL